MISLDFKGFSVTAHLLLVLLFLLTIGHLITLKVCSVKLDHRTAPLFISGWTLLGLLAVTPLYGYLWFDGWVKMTAQPYLLPLAALKGALLYLLFVVSQRLMKVSLSSRHYVTPLAVGVIAIINYFLGEHLTGSQWLAALGLCALSAGFFLRGHLSDMPPESRRDYFLLVGLSAILSSMDHVLTKNSNWFTLLLISNVVLFAISLAINIKQRDILKSAFLHRAAILAGLFYAATELVKFYQMVTINPVSVVVTAQAMTKPVILVLSALIWHERTVKEQLVWGILAFAVTLPLFL